MVIGTPSSGPRACPARQRSVLAVAAAHAPSRFNVINALSR
jgi:hypothetical protein